MNLEHSAPIFFYVIAVIECCCFGILNTSNYSCLHPANRVVLWGFLITFVLATAAWNTDVTMMETYRNHNATGKYFKEVPPLVQWHLSGTLLHWGSLHVTFALLMWKGFLALCDLENEKLTNHVG
jgi:hypothetical protein